MTPGLALFYGGMTRTRHVLNMLMMSLSTIPLVTVIWVLVGYSLAFGEGGPLLGGGSAAGLAGLAPAELATATFHLMFSIIAIALVSGAVAERMKFSAWMVFVGVWSIVVYPVIARSLFTPTGALASIGAIDFAGGLVVHVAAGASALALALVVGPRLGHRRDRFRPHSLPLTMSGAAILWVGWFGFNAGSAGGATDAAITAFLATQVGAAAGMAAWTALEWRSTGSPTLLGTVSGAIAGLVAITPAAGVVSPTGAMAIGLAGGTACWFAVRSRHRLAIDDALDVVGIHLVGGAVGSMLVAVFADARFGTDVDGLALGSASLVAPQAIATIGVAGSAFGLTWLIASILHRSIGLRVTEREELEGLDITQHDERAYTAE